MKSLLTILTLVFAMVFSSTSYAEWTKSVESKQGNTFYVDFERIRKHDGYVYFWSLTDYLKPDKFGDFSSIVYLQGDCNTFQIKYLSDSYHTEPMGRGTPSSSSNEPDKEWSSVSPNSVNEFILEQVCKFIK